MTYIDATKEFVDENGYLVGSSDDLHLFEDERVESLLKNYFLGINFKEAVKDQSKKDFARFDALWYSIVRLRKGPQNFVKQVHDLIRKYPTIHKKQIYENYLIDVEKFYQQVWQRAAGSNKKLFN